MSAGVFDGLFEKNASGMKTVMRPDFAHSQMKYRVNSNGTLALSPPGPFAGFTTALQGLQNSIMAMASGAGTDVASGPATKVAPQTEKKTTESEKQDFIIVNHGGPEQEPEDDKDSEEKGTSLQFKILELVIEK